MLKGEVSVLIGFYGNLFFILLFTILGLIITGYLIGFIVWPRYARNRSISRSKRHEYSEEPDYGAEGIMCHYCGSILDGSGNILAR